MAGYACLEEGTHHLKAISLIGTPTSGEATCQILAGKSWHFAVPINGYQLNALKESMTTALLQEVWVNYTADPKGNWIANKH